MDGRREAGERTRQRLLEATRALLAAACQAEPSQYAQVMGQFAHCQPSGERSVRVTSLAPGSASSRRRIALRLP